MDNHEACSSSTSNPNSNRRVSSVAHRLGNPKVRLGMARRSVGARQAEALALSLSFAAFVSLVVEKKSAAGQNTNVADLALIYASAVKESLASVYGQKLGSFAERAFKSTLKVIINDAAFPHQLDTREKSKLEMGVSKAAFRAERFETELPEANKAFETELKAYATELEAYMAFKTELIMDWLVSSVINTLAWMLYVSSGFSTSACMAFEEESYSWWSVLLNMLICRNRIWVQMYFSVLMILVVTYLITHRSSGTKHRRVPMVYNLLFLGIVLGLLSKFCLDTLGNFVKPWPFVCAMLCLLQYAVDVTKLAVFGLLDGLGTKSSNMVRYWAPVSLLLIANLLVVPLINGLLPFAMFGVWGDDLSIGMDALNSWLGRALMFEANPFLHSYL